MKLLLDTATLLWVTHDAAKLSAVARQAYADVGNELYVSVASLWEIIVKNRLGKLPLPAPIEKVLEPLKASGTVRILPLTEGAVYRLQSLPDTHRDPFDRMLVCQAIEAGLTILIPDSVFSNYPVATLW
jgi:PIN domain nuclease of toxin-antitoxin system